MVKIIKVIATFDGCYQPIVVQILESVRMLPSEPIYFCQREVYLDIVTAEKQIGMILNGVIVKVRCRPPIDLTETQADAVNQTPEKYRDCIRYHYSEHGEDLTSVSAPLLTNEKGEVIFVPIYDDLFN